MAKVSYASLKLKPNAETRICEFNGQQIEVTQYLPIADKYDLVMITLQQSKEEEIYNELKLDLFFCVNLIYFYTNINFTDKQREDPFKIFDCIKSNGLLDKILELIPDEEYDELFSYLQSIRTQLTKTNQTVAKLIKDTVGELPDKMQTVSTLINQINPETFKEVGNFIQAVNGGNPL